MQQNNYWRFGNSIKERYMGMVARINPLALVFLQTGEDGRIPITNINRYLYRIGHTINYNIINRHIQNRYIQNNYRVEIKKEEEKEALLYDMSRQILKEYRQWEVKEHFLSHNTSVQNSLKMILQSFSGSLKDAESRQSMLRLFSENSSQLPTAAREHLLREIRQIIQQNTGEVIERIIHDEKWLNSILTLQEYALGKKLSERLSGEYLTKLRTQTEADAAVLLIQHSLPKMIEEHIILTHKELKQEWDSITRQAGEGALKKQNIFWDIVRKRITSHALARAGGVSQSVIRQEIHRFLEKKEVTEELTKLIAQTDFFRENVENNEKVQTEVEILLEKALEHTDIVRKGKYRYERQVIGRLMPLPVRPVTFSFAGREKSIPEESLINKPPLSQHRVIQMIKQQNGTEKRYYTHFIDRFLNTDRPGEDSGIDRSKLPAGIIYHEKPSQGVRFIHQDVIRLAARETASEASSAALSTGQQDYHKEVMNISNLMDTEQVIVIHSDGRVEGDVGYGYMPQNMSGAKLNGERIYLPGAEADWQQNLLYPYREGSQPWQELLPQLKEGSHLQQELLHQLKEGSQPRQRLLHRQGEGDLPHQESVEESIKKEFVQQRLLQQLKEGSQPRQELLPQLREGSHLQQELFHQLKEGSRPQQGLLQQLKEGSQPQQRLFQQLKEISQPRQELLYRQREEELPHQESAEESIKREFVPQKEARQSVEQGVQHQQLMHRLQQQIGRRIEKQQHGTERQSEPDTEHPSHIPVDFFHSKISRDNGEVSTAHQAAATGKTNITPEYAGRRVIRYEGIHFTKEGQRGYFQNQQKPLNQHKESFSGMVLQPSPVSLVHKDHKEKETEAGTQEKLKEEKTTELFRDIVFERKTVKTQEINEEAIKGKSLPSHLLSRLGNNSLKEEGVEKLILESVSRQMEENISRQMEENIPRISRKVYQNISDQLKKEQERRGM